MFQNQQWIKLDKDELYMVWYVEHLFFMNKHVYFIFKRRFCVIKMSYERTLKDCRITFCKFLLYHICQQSFLHNVKRSKQRTRMEVRHLNVVQIFSILENYNIKHRDTYNRNWNPRKVGIIFYNTIITIIIKVIKNKKINWTKINRKNIYLH